MADKIDIERAKLLRLSGLSLKEVAEQMGCSLAWCKTYLKGLKVVNKDKEIIAEVRTKGKTKEGVSSAEVRSMVKRAYDKMHGKELETKIADVKKAARRDNSDVLIRPYWMKPDEAKECTTLMLEYANEVWQFKEHLARKYRREFDLDESFHNSILYALTAMSSGNGSKLLPQGLLSHGQQLERITTELASRQQGNAPQPINLVPQQFEVDTYDYIGHDVVSITPEDMDNIPMFID